jgi:hypothetical protein
MEVAIHQAMAILGSQPRCDGFGEGYSFVSVVPVAVDAQVFHDRLKIKLKVVLAAGTQGADNGHYCE